MAIAEMTDNKHPKSDPDTKQHSLPDHGQSSADKARALLQLLEAAGSDHTNAAFQLDSEVEESDDDDADYMEDDGTFLVHKGDDPLDEQEEQLPPIKDGMSPAVLDDMYQLDLAIPELHHHGEHGTSKEPIKNILGEPTLWNGTAVEAASAAIVAEEEWSLPISSKKSKKDKKKKKFAQVFRKAENEDHGPGKEGGSVSPTSVPLPGDGLLLEDLPPLEEGRPSSPLLTQAPIVVEQLEFLSPTALEDEWASPVTSRKSRKDEYEIATKGRNEILDEPSGKEETPVKQNLGAVYPVPISDPSRFDSRPNDRLFAPTSALRRYSRERHSGSEKLRTNAELLVGATPSTAIRIAAVGSAARPSDEDHFPRKPKPRGVMGRMRASLLNLSKRLVQALETRDEYGDDGELEDDLAFGEDDYGETRAPPPAPREMPKPPTSSPLQHLMVLPGPDFPQPPPKKSASSQKLPPKPPGEFETLLRTKIFKPAVELTTALPRLPWIGPVTQSTPPLFTRDFLMWRELRPLGQFVAERDRTLREDLKDLELGVGAGAGGFSLDFSTKGVLALLKPVQWINLWRSYEKRRVDVSSHVLKRLSQQANAVSSGHQADKDQSLLTASSTDGEHHHEREHRLLHELEHELMSTVKYQFGESQYITVITYSDGSSGGDRVDSGAIALFKASAFSPRTGGAQAIKVDLEARFQDIPGPICRILAREGNPNRFEIKRNGRSLSVKDRGKVAPPRPGVVRVVKTGAKGRAQLHGQGNESGKEWEGIGGSWRRALHILLDHSDGDREVDGGGGEDEEEDTCPNEGLIATIPQMLALLHLRYRAVDTISSTSVFTFSQPLRCDAMSAYVRRGVRLLGPPVGATHVGSTGTVAVLFSKESQWVREQLFWA
ncbi:hypothetical protein V8F20_011570 [Naviculisporaceae sp. PSN 640]